MNYNDPRFRGLPRAKGPNLIVSLRESLIEDSRIAHVVRSVTELVELPLAQPGVSNPSGDVPANVAELPPFETLREHPHTEGTGYDSPREHDVDEPARTAARRSFAIRLFRGLVPGFFSLVAIVAVIVLLGLGQYDKSLILGSWETVRGWFPSGSELHSGVVSGTTGDSTASNSISDDNGTRVDAVAARQDAQLQIQSLSDKLGTATKDLAVTRGLVDQLAVKQDEIVRDIIALQAAQLALSQKVAAFHPRPSELSSDPLASQQAEMARTIAELQAAQSILSQKISTLQSRYRVRAKGAQAN